MNSRKKRKKVKFFCFLQKTTENRAFHGFFEGIKKIKDVVEMSC